MNKHIDTAQLGFDTLLKDAETENRNRVFARETAHLPGTMEAAIPYYRDLIAQNHAAMLAADTEGTRRIHEDAHLLAEKLNGGEPDILAHDDAPGYVLARATEAEPGAAFLWGQTGTFEIDAAGMAIRIEMEGLFGIGAGWGFWPGFAAHAVDTVRPFLSETGYRSFLGVHADPAPGHTPDSFAAMVIEAYVKKELLGKLVAVEPTYHR